MQELTDRDIVIDSVSGWFQRMKAQQLDERYFSQSNFPNVPKICHWDCLNSDLVIFNVSSIKFDNCKVMF